MKKWKKIAYLQLHRICDQDCIFCAQPTNWNYMNFLEIKKQIDFYISKWYDWIIFSWWEPTISPFFFETIKYCNEKKLDMKILSNWHKFEDEEFVKKSIEFWLKKFHISIHSHNEKIHDALVKKNWWYKRSLKSMKNIIKLWWSLTINITINNYNVDFFPKSILFFIKAFPSLDWFIINNLETSQIKSTYFWVIAPLEKVYKIAKKTLDIIIKNNKRVRIERVPLCYIRWYEHLSADIEFSLFNERKFLHFLDNSLSGELNKNTFSAEYTYWKNCLKCDFRWICSWLEWIWKHYKEEDLYTQKITKQDILNIKRNYMTL